MKRRIATLFAAGCLSLLFGLGAFGVHPSTAFAADVATDTLTTVGDQTGLSATDPKIIIGNIIRTALGVVGIILVCVIVYGGFVWMTAAGRPDQVDKAKKILINAVIGLVIILLSWSIATFIVSSLTNATGTGGGNGGGGSGGTGGYGLGGGSASVFTVTGFSPDGAVSIRNIVPRVTFSKSVDSTTVNGNIAIADASGTAVAGTFAASGNTVKFTPSTACPEPNTDRFCFDESATFTVTVSSGLLSSGGTAITCDTTTPCTATFTSGTVVDTKNPSATISYPDGTVPTASTTDFQVIATDDAGVSTADFFVDDEWQDTVPGTGTVDETISTIIDTSSFVDGTRYTFKATVTDLAGNEDSDSLSVRAKPEWCYNGVEDTDLGETGIDCGGDSSLATYCGACDGSSCTDDSECSSGSCVAGVCTSNPSITGISPEDGSVGTYVTISGTDFGSNAGTVFFTDAAGTGTVAAKVQEQCAEGWSDTQVVVAVPSGAGDGPITLTNGNDVSDSTNDDSGELVPNFDVNDTVHPSLCSLSKSSGTSTSALTLSGANFGDAQGTSTVAFSAIAAGSYTSWADGSVKVTVPSAAAGDYDVSVTVGGETSNTLAFAVTEATTDASTITDVSPSEGGIGQYVTIAGTNFGSSVGTVTFTSSSGDTATGSIDFPTACSSDYWDADQVIIIVPEKFDNGTALSSGAYTVTVTNQKGVTSSSADFTVTDAAPTPGICSMTSTADVGGTVTISGDHFALSTDTVTFYNGVKTLTASSWNNNSITVVVPEGSVTGPVTVTVAGVESNSANLSVGATSTSSTSTVAAAYAWDFSTGTIARAPSVVSECSADTVSAVPNNRYSEQEEICVNAVVYAEFTTLMNEATVEDAVTVEKCTASVSSATDDPCATTDVVSGVATAESGKTSTRVTWIPDADFSPDTTYRVTISTGALSTESIAMAADATWKFTTSTTTDVCVVDRVTVTPSEESLTVDGDTAGFSANAGTGCVVVDSSDYAWDWSVDSYSYVDFSSTADSKCVGDPTACATLEALAEGQTTVTATAINAEGSGSVSDDATLTVNFTDPYVANFAPNCTEACTNASVYATFNTAMTESDITAGDHVVLYECTNELCTNLTRADANPSCTFDASDATRCTGFAFNASTLAPGKYYRVIVSGDVTSSSGVALIRTNYGSDYSWTFRVREDGTACAVERIDLSPTNPVVSAVGDSTAFTVEAFGAADSCSTSGQKLAGADYDWGWTDPIPDSDQNTETTGYTAAWSTISGGLFDGGESTIVEGCSALCTPIGSSPFQAICGDGVLDKNADGSGEECDDGDARDHDGCSSTCLYEGSAACATAGTGTNCCGNGTIDVAYASEIAENCDDGNTVNGDGCSSTCLAEGSASVGATCGNNDIAFDATTHAGEVCDDGNNASGDGCSRQCLPEGSRSLASLGGALCGDGKITSPYETCDDGNTADDDGCSSTCVREGLSACTATVKNNCCGNGTVDQNTITGAGEDCESADGAEGCSSTCTFEGSSVNYAEPSVCGDGVVGTGEYSSCESTSSTGDGNTDAVQVAYMSSDAVKEVNPETQEAIATVTVSEATSGLYATSDFALTCAASNDQDCSDPETTGVGDSRCCVDRPTLQSSSPTGASVCRNAAINGVFSEEMNKSSFTFSETSGSTTTTTPYMYVKLNLASGETCPTNYTKLAIETSSFFGKIVSTLRTFFLGEDAEAAAAAGAADSGDCILPIDSYTQTDMGDGTFKVTLNYSTALEANSSYTLVIVGDDDTTDKATEGVTSKLGAGMNGTQSVTFTTGTDICTLDVVSVDDTDADSPNTFTTTNESHTFTATPMSYSGSTRQEITSIAGVYSWTWSGWESSNTSLFTATQGSATALDTATVAAVGDNGDATIVATATVTDSTGATAKTSTVDGTADVTALLCEDPWPALSTFPWTDDASGDSGAAVGTSGYMNFAVSYCKDYGTDNDETDNLPDVKVVLAPSSPSSKVLKEYLFEIDPSSSTASTGDAGDVIGVRIVSNADYLSPMAWYEAQGFTGSPSETTVDGFQAVTDDRSTYVAMANSTASGLYSNILVISYNEGASDVTKAVYDQMLENLSFLTNVTDTPVCSTTASTSCSADADCPSGETCLDDKAKIMRDTARLGDIKDVSIAVDAYSADNKTCSSTTSQSCDADSDCPGDETCEVTVPALSSGTSVRSLASSAWSSWQETLGGAVDATSLPTDPLNAYAACSGYDSATCVNQTSGSYSCPAGSFVYHYRSVGSRDYEVTTELEYTALSWVNDVDADSTDNVTFYTSSYCDGDVYGSSSTCGDGIIGTSSSGANETCEIGQVHAETCTTADGSTGTANATCNSTCSGYDAVPAGATCTATSCGDGIVNGTEECDDGAKNGEYGYCGDSCTFASGSYCGDGVISGGEACDCGDSSTTATSSSRPYAGSAGSCVGYNGAYGSNLNTTCAWDCSGPAGYCGDATVDSGESCDGNADAYSGKICADGVTKCTTDADCGGATCGGLLNGECPAEGYLCNGGTNDGYVCYSPSWSIAANYVGDYFCETLGGGTCERNARSYQTYHTRTCDDGSSTSMCGWNAWDYCNANGQSCGNGVVDGDEECDDGNDIATDSCTTACTVNVCGDGYLYSGSEECDQGTSNGAACDSAYESTCTACSTTCHYTVSSGEFCGDGVINGAEYCDGADVPYVWYNYYSSTNGQPVSLGSCTAAQAGDGYVDDMGGPYTYVDSSGATQSLTQIICAQVGLCNGGTNNGGDCASDSQCTGGGECVMPVCNASCSASCPTTESTTTLLLTTNQPGAIGEGDVDVYSYSTSSTSNTPNAATITIPACTVAGNLVADVDFSGVTPPDVYVVFVTDRSGSMGETDMTGGEERLAVARDSITSAIQTLFDELGSTVQIGLVSFDSTLYTTTGFTTSERTLTDDVAAYTERDGGTNTYLGLDEAKSLFDAAATGSNVAKIAILLSDGQPSDSSTSSVDGVSGATTSAEALIAAGYEVYTIALTSDSTLIDNMNTWSSNTVCDASTGSCTTGNSYNTNNLIDYSFDGTSTAEVSGAYDSIVDSIVNGTASLISSSGGTVVVDSGSVSDSHNITLPWPSNFSCDGVSEQEVPIQITFRGDGKINVSNVHIDYCAP